MSLTTKTVNNCVTDNRMPGNPMVLPGNFFAQNFVMYKLCTNFVQNLYNILII